MLKITLLRVKTGYLIQIVQFTYVPRWSCSTTPWLQKKKGIVKMVDGSICEVIGTRTVKVTERDGTVRALEAIRFIAEARYNLISIRMLEKEGCRI